MGQLKRIDIALASSQPSDALREVKAAIERRVDLLCVNATVPNAHCRDDASAAPFVPTLCQTFKQCGWQERALPHVAVILDWTSTEGCTPTALSEMVDAAEDAGYLLEWRFIPRSETCERPTLVFHGIHGTHGPSWIELAGCIMANPQERPIEWINNRSVLSQALPLLEPVKALAVQCSLRLESEWDEVRKHEHRAGLVFGEFFWDGVLAPPQGCHGVESVFDRIEDAVSRRMSRTDTEWKERLRALAAKAVRL